MNRTSKQSITNPNDLFKKINADSSVLTAHQKEHSSKISNPSSSWRSKRAEDETLDVVADPVKIIELSADSDFEGFFLYLIKKFKLIFCIKIKINN